MQKIRQKKQKFAQDLRRQYRESIFTSNRSEYDSGDDSQFKLWISAIFNFINDYEQSSAQLKDDFQKFLGFLTQQSCELWKESEKLTRYTIIKAVNDKYQSCLHQFWRTNDFVQAINNPLFALTRFLLRIKIIQTDCLIFLDKMLHNNLNRLSVLPEQLSQKQNTQNQVALLNEYMKLLKEKKIIMAQIHFLYIFSQSTIQNKQSNSCFLNYDGQILKEILQQIQLLFKKWYIEQLVMPFAFDLRFMSSVRKNQILCDQLFQIVKQIEDLYIYFLSQTKNEQMKETIFNMNKNKKSPHKIIQIIFMLFFSIQGKKPSRQIDVDHNKDQEQQLVELYLKVYSQIFTQICTKIELQKQQKEIKKTYQNLLQILISSFLEKPSKFFTQSLQEENGNKIIEHASLVSILKFSQMFIASQSDVSQKSMLQRVITLIPKLQPIYVELSLEILSKICSKKDSCINLLFSKNSIVKNFPQTLRRLMTHFYVNIVRKSYWLLINVTASQEYYEYGLQFIQKVYKQILLDKSIVANQTGHSVTHQIVNMILNYISNIRDQSELQNLIKITKNSIPSTISSNMEDNYQYQPDRSHNMFLWIIQTLGYLVRDICQTYQSNLPDLKIFQILLYAIYNLITIDTAQQQKLIMWQLYDRQQIPKNLQQILFKTRSQTTQQRQNQQIIQGLLKVFENLKQKQQN